MALLGLDLTGLLSICGQCHDKLEFKHGQKQTFEDVVAATNKALGVQQPKVRIIQPCRICANQVWRCTYCKRKFNIKAKPKNIKRFLQHKS